MTSPGLHLTKLTIDGQIWQQVRDFAHSGPGDAVYRLTFGPNSETEIVFGDGRNGRRPPDGAECSATFDSPTGPVGVTMRRAEVPATQDQTLWVAIRNSSNALSFCTYGGDRCSMPRSSGSASNWCRATFVLLALVAVLLLMLAIRVYAACIALPRAVPPSLSLGRSLRSLASPLTRRLSGGLKRAPWLAGLGLIIGACASREPPPTHFGPWGPISRVQEPDRSVLVAAITALTIADAKSVVLARYAGDIYRRLDLASLNNQVPVAVDVGGQLGPIDTGSATYRARVFETDFPGKTTILEVSAPNLRGGWATLTAWRWDALAWNCDLPGRAEHLTLRLEDKHWKVTVTSTDPKGLLLQTDCP